MKTDSLTIRSSISPKLYKKTLFRGSFLSFLGFLPLLYGSLWMDAATLSIWGIPLFFLGMGLIMWGMLPLKRIKELQKHPNELHWIDNHTISYDHKGKKTMTIPLSSVDTLTHFEDEAIYGIKLKFKNELEHKVTVHDPRFAYERYERASQKRYGCDLFFPYFSKRSFAKFQLESNHAS